MRLYKRIFLISMVLLSILLDTSVLPFTGINMLYTPKVALLTIVVIALLLGRTQGILYGAVAGVLMDITVAIPTGLVSIVYTVSGLISGYIGRKSRYRMLSSVIAPVLSMLIYEITLMVYYFSSAGAVTGSMFLMALVRTVIGTVIVQLMYLGFNLVLKPKHSRYLRR
ncbi:MAG: rod shape-determining protein MreD [Clostridia bacterium]|nr:rod shape-determining protein MreD [Clostridia bacterium]